MDPQVMHLAPLLRWSGATAATVLLMSLAVFGLAAISPIDPIAAMMGDSYQTSTTQSRANLTTALGLDTHWLASWAHWLTNLAHGDFGWSHTYNQPVIDVMAKRLGWTILLSGIALAAATTISLALGIVAGLYPHSRTAAAIRLACRALQAIPPFVLALAAISIAAVAANIAPAGGAAPVGAQPHLTTIGPWLWLPATVLTITYLPWPTLAVAERLTDPDLTHLTEALRLRGIADTHIAGHILRPVLTPLTALVGARLGELIVGAAIVEASFTWPGIGTALVDAAKTADLALLAPLAMLTCLAVMVGSAISDHVAHWATPHQREKVQV